MKKNKIYTLLQA